MLGVYEEGELIDTVSSELKTSEILLPLIREYLDKYDISTIIDYNYKKI